MNTSDYLIECKVGGEGIDGSSTKKVKVVNGKKKDTNIAASLFSLLFELNNVDPSFISYQKIKLLILNNI